jgi:hypothetical protein
VEKYFRKERVMKKRSFIKALACVLLAVLMILGCSCNGGGADSGAQEPELLVRALRTKVDAAKGGYLGIKDVEVVEINRDLVPDDYLIKTNEVVGRALLADIKAGDVIGESMLAEKKEASSGNISVSLAKKLGYVVITDYLEPNTGEDLSTMIQKVIDKNPRKTIFFPDGVYTIARPIMTSSNPQKAVSLHLSGFAVIKASDRWRGGADYMIQLGAIDETFTIDQTGSNYYMYGGIVDGNAKAKGIILEGGRETSIRQISIKNVTQGLKIAYNEVYGSNDCDFESLEIEGCYFPGSTGVHVDGLDNTLTDIRISGFEIGMHMTRAGNLMHNVHAVYEHRDKWDYNNSIGFLDSSGSNWMDGFHAEGFRVGFRLAGGALDMMNDCVASWPSSEATAQTAIVADGRFASVATNFKAEFGEDAECVFLQLGKEGGKGVIQYPIFDKSKVEDLSYMKHIVGKVIWNS